MSDRLSSKPGGTALAVASAASMAAAVAYASDDPSTQSKWLIRCSIANLVVPTIVSGLVKAGSKAIFGSNRPQSTASTAKSEREWMSMNAEEAILSLGSRMLDGGLVDRESALGRYIELAASIKEDEDERQTMTTILDSQWQRRMKLLRLGELESQVKVELEAKARENLYTRLGGAIASQVGSRLAQNLATTAVEDLGVPLVWMSGVIGGQAASQLFESVKPVLQRELGISGG